MYDSKEFCDIVEKTLKDFQESDIYLTSEAYSIIRWSRMNFVTYWCANKDIADAYIKWYPLNSSFIILRHAKMGLIMPNIKEIEKYFVKK